MSQDASHALAAREKVQNLLNAALTGNLEFFKKSAEELDMWKGLAKTVEAVKEANDRGALHFAAREGQIEACRYLVEELKLDVNVVDGDGETPLIHAARQGQTATAKYLLEHGVDATIASSLGGHCTASFSRNRLLLSKGVDVDSESDAGTPLVWAAGHAQKDAVEVLLEHYANLNAETEDDITSLLSAVAAGSLPCLKLLIQDAGADPNVADEDGQKPIQVAAAGGNREIVEVLLPLTSPIKSVHEWTVDGILEHMQSKNQNQEGANLKGVVVANGQELPKWHPPEVSKEAKKKAAEAKLRGDEAFRRKEYMTAIDAYTQAIDFDPSDGTYFSNRSLCWVRLGQAEHALADAKACRSLKPNLAKACYREGAALRVLQRFEEAAIAFYDGVQLDPENKELVTAFREAVEAGKKFHGTDQVKP
ncbi:Ankyrin repeat and SOCS box protein 3-like protein [Drosera capensis]